MKHLSIDIETYSEIDIKKSGLFRYALDPSTEVLLFAYSIDFGEVLCVDLALGEKIPDEVILALGDDMVTKHAFNASFEYHVLKQAGFSVGSRRAWRCTMFHASYVGYPGGLDMVGKAIGLLDDQKKSASGTALINFFSKPCKPSKANGNRTRNLPKHDMDKWQLFKDYNIQDVVAESEIYKRVSLFPVPEREWAIWELSDEMNELGVRIDSDLKDGAVAIDDEVSTRLSKRAREISGIKNPKSMPQVLEFLQSYDADITDCQKATVSDILARDGLPDDVREFLEIRQELGKSSVSKYTKMDVCECDDGRLRGLLSVYGARTGRWAGRLVQVQNLPRNYLDSLELARSVVKEKNADLLGMLYGNIPDTLSQLIRTTFIPADGKKFVVADYAAIEARVVAWIAGEEWVNEVFATHGKIYEETASRMFNVPLEKIQKGNPEYALRQRGKVATLALGYQGGVNALCAMGADRMGLSATEMEEIVDKWRGANPNIVAFWYAVQDAAIKAIQTGAPQSVRCLTFRLECEGIYGQSFLTIELPSGRKIFYPSPFLEENRFGKQAVHFFTQVPNKKLWRPEGTYGGKLTENIVQAVARDCLAHLLLILRERYPEDPVVMHIHDEVVMEAHMDLTVDEICKVMAEPIPWAPGLILKGAGFEKEFYMKD